MVATGIIVMVIVVMMVVVAVAMVVMRVAHNPAPILLLVFVACR
jgi:hypothetical protein